MPLIEDEKKLPFRKLILIGVPAFVFAVTISMLTHQCVHIIVGRAMCGSGAHNPSIVSAIDLPEVEGVCALASFAGICWTLMLAIVSFAFFLRRPGNLFLASMAFINASTRIPATVTVFLQLLFHGKAKLIVDESTSLTLLHFQDPSLAVIILFFLSLVTIFLTVTVVYDTKGVPWKWPIALLMFLAIAPIEKFEWNLIAHFIR